MARIHDLIRQVAAQSPDLARDLAREVDVLSERRAFGLNFERHTPEEVELPGRPVRRGDKVHILPTRGETPKAANAVVWVVESIDRAAEAATVARVDANGTVETQDVAIADVVVVAEFRDPIYPGLVSTGTVERGGDKPYHSVINGENFHALQTLLFTHRGKVDVIYIDPPYNTGARDWKYNNDYVESDDQYRHSKWLAFMERRLLLAKELLNPDDSVLIVTIDEKEYLRLGLLLEQTFTGARVQMVSATISPRGTSRDSEFSRVDEYLFFVFVGSVQLAVPRGSAELEEVRLPYLRRTSMNSTREQGRPKQFYPIYVDPNGQDSPSIAKIGLPIPKGVDRTSVPDVPGLVTVWPVNPAGVEMTWGMVPETLQRSIDGGYVRVSPGNTPNSPFVFAYLTTVAQKKVESGEYIVTGERPDGTKIVAIPGGRASKPTTVWRETAHDAGAYGTGIVTTLLPGRRFPFPKSLYAVEDTLRYFIGDRPNAVVVDFFSGSGTTAHAVFRLNKQDGGRRVSICVTNNEVSANEQTELRRTGLRPGDPEWEQWGICEFITKPRIAAAITGLAPDGAPITGEYKFNDVFPMAEGFAENVEFLNLTYEAPLRVASHRDFPKVAPLLWLRAGSVGRRIESPEAGWGVADTYGVLADLDKTDEFVTTVAAAPDLRVVFVVTDEDRLFEAIVRDLPDHVEPVRMYDAYLRNFELESRVPR